MKKRRHYIQILFCPPLTTNERRRNRMDARAKKIERRYTAYAASFGEARDKGYKLLGKAEAKELPRLSGWDPMIWITDIRRKKRA